MRRSLADELRIASPCHEDSASMTPSASGRGLYCGACERDVHAVAELTRAEVEALVRANAGGRLCLELMVRNADGAIVVADGYVQPTRIAPRRALPILAVAASMTMAACTPSSALRPDEPVVLVPPPASPATTAPTLLAAPLPPTSPAPTAPVPEPISDEPDPPAPPQTSHAVPSKPPHPTKPIVRPNHTMTKGGRG